MLMDAEQKKEEYKDRLRFKVDEIKRKEEDLIMWEDNVANREWKVEHSEDNIVSLMREVKLKDILLIDKTNEVNKKNKEMEDCFREARADVRREIEVCRSVIWCYCVFKDLKRLYGIDKGSYNDGYQVC